MTVELPADTTAAVGARAGLWRRSVVAGLIVVLAAGLTQLNPRWRWPNQSAPYPATAVHAGLTVSVTNSPQEAQAKLDTWLGGRRLNTANVPTTDADGVPNGWRQHIVGQLTLDPPAKASGDDQYVLFVIDNRLNQPVPDLFGASRTGVIAASGWDGRYQRIAAKYRWLHSVAAIHTDGGWTNPGMSMSVPANTHGTITFDAVVSDNALPITNPAHDLTFALVFVGKDIQPYWAEQLTPPR